MINDRWIDNWPFCPLISFTIEFLAAVTWMICIILGRENFKIVPSFCSISKKDTKYY